LLRAERDQTMTKGEWRQEIERLWGSKIEHNGLINGMVRTASIMGLTPTQAVARMKRNLAEYAERQKARFPIRKHPLTVAAQKKRAEQGKS